MASFDIAFVGNGVITYISALEIRNLFPKAKIAIIGLPHRPYSASFAAGAMQAVFCEIEDTLNDSARDREVFDAGLEAREKWGRLLARNGMTDVVTSDSTIMYYRKGGTAFEKVNFDLACEVAANHNCLDDVRGVELEDIFCGPLRPSDVVARKFKGEFAIDPEAMFRKARAILTASGVEFFDQHASGVEQLSNTATVRLADGRALAAGRVVCAAGTETARLLPPGLKMIPLYHAVGTAMVLDSGPASWAKVKSVVRTPNRGGAQCGMHIVPRTDGRFYLGAGNYLSDQEPAHRVETLRYLIDICDQELFGKQAIYRAKAELRLGSRPKSMDGYPILGSFDQAPNIFVATGMYRIGLTIAPVVGEQIRHWFEGLSSDRFAGWSPERAPRPYSTMEAATRYFSESRISNLIEHGLLDPLDHSAIEAKKSELVAIAMRLNAQSVRNADLPSEFVIDPDIWAILANDKA